MVGVGHWILDDPGGFQVVELVEKAVRDQPLGGRGLVITGNVPFVAGCAREGLIEFR